MKKLNKLFSALLALLALGFVSTSFVSCSDDDDGPSTVATYKNSDATEDDYQLITFYSDNTFKVHFYKKDSFDLSKAGGTGTLITITDLDYATGTYEGNLNVNGEVVCKVLKDIYGDDDSGDDDDSSDSTSDDDDDDSVPTAGTIKVTNKDIPLIALKTPYEIKATISDDGKTAKAEIEGEESTFKRQ